MIERCYGLRRAAEIVGVNRETLKRWLRVDLGLVLPRVTRGSRVMIRESDLNRLIDKRGPRTNWVLLRSPSKRRNIA